MEDTGKRFMTVEEVADLLHLKKNTIYKKVTARDIPSIRIGGRTLFDVAEIEQWIAENQRPAISSAVRRGRSLRTASGSCAR